MTPVPPTWNPDAGRTSAGFAGRLEVADSRQDSRLSLAAWAAPTGAVETWSLDVSTPAPADLPVIWQDRNPEGLGLSANRLHFMKDGRPWLPVMGEMHYCRCPNESWEDELRKMQAGGVEIAAAYVLWNHHEREPGKWDWSGDRDLRRFVECARQAGLFVWLRTGPYCNAEARNGGLPDWVEKLPGKRTNDPDYLKHCRELYRQIGAQIKGLCFRDGGPIIGIQLENEYASGQAEHIAALHAMAREFGMRVPFYSVTGNTVFFNTQDDVIPMQGSYAYRGWEPEGGGPTHDFLFGDDAWIMTVDCQRCYYDFSRFPRAAAELGTGSPMQGDTRFTVEPAIIEAAVQNQIGRGLTLLGYYMFHGGTQIPGVERDGWPLTYDFQAPLGEFGQRSPTYNRLRLYHNFLRDYGAALAVMPCFRATDLPQDPADIRKPRFAVRSNGRSGFVFLNNTQKNVAMPGRRFRLALHTAAGPVQLPDELHAPLFLRDRTCAMLPFNMDLDGITLAWATVQPFAKIEVNGVPWHFFFWDRATGTIPVFGFHEDVAITGADGRRTTGNAVEGGCHADFEWWDLRAGKARCRVFLFSKEMAERVYRIRLAGMERLVITGAQLIERDGAIELRSCAREFDLSIMPPLSTPLIPRQDAVKLIDGARTAVMSPHTIRIPETGFAIDEPVLGKDRTKVKVPAQWPDTWSEFLIEVDYLGSSADLMVCGRKKTDHLMYGPAWVIGASRFMPDAAKDGIEFQVQPWHAGIAGVAPEKKQLILEAGASAAVICSVRAWPEYRVELKVGQT